MSYETVVVQAIREKLKYHRSQLYDRIRSDEILHPNYLFRHTGSFGQTGTGKTTNRVATIECRLKYGFKVVVFDTQDEMEFISLPLNEGHPIYNKLLEQGRRPKGLRTHILIPLAYYGGQRIIPYKEIPTNWDFFLLDLYDLEITAQDWNILMGGLSGVQEQILKTALLKRDPKWGILDVYVETQKRYLQGNYGYPDVTEDDMDSEPIPVVKSVFPKQSITTLNRAIMDLNSARFLAPRIWRGKRTPYLLNWENELLNRKTVTILKVSLLPPKLQHALCTYILRKTFILAQKRYLNDGRRVPPVAFVVPEATDFFPNKIPDEHKETLPPLREAFLMIFRKGRRHQVVIDFDTAYYSSIPDEVINQTHYIFLYDNDKEILEDCVKRFNPINNREIRGVFDLLKEKGSCIMLSRHKLRAVFTNNLIPGCRVALEGENFLEVWRNVYPNRFKPVDPYYKTLKLIHQDIKKRVREIFKQLQEQVKVSRKRISDNLDRFCKFIATRIQETGKTEFKSNQLINDFRMNTPDKLSKPTLYEYLEELNNTGIIKLKKTTRPYTLTVNIEKLKQIVTPKEAE
jgi:hypothetical protein